MGLFDKISENQSLRFIDENDPAQELALAELGMFAFPGNDKALVFLYLDNSIAAVTGFLSVLKSPHVLVMLSLDLAENFKTELEKNYSPAFIIDKKRDSIHGYEKKDHFFERAEKSAVDIHPSIKILLSTSGTTGSPKFVKLSDENLLSNAIAITLQHILLNYDKFRLR